MATDETRYVSKGEQRHPKYFTRGQRHGTTLRLRVLILGSRVEFWGRNIRGRYSGTILN